jgi:hypothetical protein
VICGLSRTCGIHRSKVRVLCWDATSGDACHFIHAAGRRQPTVDIGLILCASYMFHFTHAVIELTHSEIRTRNDFYARKTFNTTVKLFLLFFLLFLSLPPPLFFIAASYCTIRIVSGCVSGGACFECRLQKPRILRFFLVVLSPYIQMLGCCLKQSHGCFFPNSSQFIIHYRTKIRECGG